MENKIKLNEGSYFFSKAQEDLVNSWFSKPTRTSGTKNSVLVVGVVLALAGIGYLIYNKIKKQGA